MSYEAIYKDADGNVVTEVLDSSYPEAWAYCEKVIQEANDRTFWLVEVIQNIPMV